MGNIKLTEKQLFDFITCPVKYDFIHNKKIIMNEDITIPKILNITSNYFYTYLLENKKPITLKQLFNKYESIYKKYNCGLSEKKYNDGLLLIRNFYYWAIENKIAVIDSNSKYTLNYKNIILNGILNPISINKNKQLEFLILNFSQRIPDQLELDMKLKYTIDTLAFNQSNDDYNINAVKYHNVKTSKDLYTTRNKNDFKRLYSTLEGVTSAIENNSYYPHETHMCNNCSYKFLCKAWYR